MQDPAQRSSVDRSVSVLVDAAHVTYRVYEDRRAGVRELWARGLRPRPYREIRAIRGVSFVAHAGEGIGVIGPNGSGKSTLMSALTGLLPVTRGAIYARSQPALLGVGAALKPALSGRRNVEIGCLALGMTRKEVERRFDAIVDFSGLHRSIDLPLRTYSKGMRARLHFAIATVVTPKILLIDEALAVGDQDFRQRSMARIRGIREEAGTVFLVSHNLQEIGRTCSRVLWLRDGLIVQDGEPADVIAAYRAATPP
jgi:teichoic acid transport system ATP-binding protein